MGIVEVNTVMAPVVESPIIALNLDLLGTFEVMFPSVKPKALKCSAFSIAKPIQGGNFKIVKCSLSNSVTSFLAKSLYLIFSNSVNGLNSMVGRIRCTLPV